MLTKAFRSGHREAAGWLCSILLFDESNRPTLVGDVDRVCGAAASDLGKPLADIHIDPDYALNYLVPMARFYEEKGQDLKAASCYGSYIRNFDKLSPGWKSRDRSRLELDNASKGMTGIFLQRTLRGRFRGGQADAFGPLGTEPIPPCGLSSVEIGVLAGSVILKKGLAPN